jgi:hypothetical protein
MKKSFDAVAWMRKRREEIDMEDKGLTWAEKREKTRRLLENDPLYRRLCGRNVYHQKERIITVQEKTGGSGDKST